MESKKLPAIVIPTEIRRVSYQIEQWRSTRTHRNAMPEPLWRQAAKVAKEYGLARIARILRLDYYSLKERIEPQEQDGRATSVVKPTFIELQPLPATSASECTIELDHPGGFRMRIQVKGAPMPDIAALSRTLWGMKA